MVQALADKDSVVLEARDITKTFPGVKALDNVSFQIHRGKINALVGENGAGKSTLVKVLSGVYAEYGGKVLLEGEEVSFANPRQAQNSGVVIIHQELNLIPHLSVSENVFLGREYTNRLGLIDYKRMYVETERILKQLNLRIAPNRLICDLRVGQQQIVEIAKALSFDARVIIMDEPTSAVSEREVQVLFGLIRSLKEHGVGIVYITHKLDEVFQIADRATVMRDGKVVGSCLPEEVGHDDIVRMMVGRDIKDFFVKSHASEQQELLSVRDICLDHPTRSEDYLVDHVSFSVNQGEVLGIFGLMGAGRTELLETVFGVHPQRSSGAIHLQGRQVRIKSPWDAIDCGIGLVPEDRKQQGLVLLMSVRANISLASLKLTERFSLLSSQLERQLASDYIARLKIKTASAGQRTEDLSGGNQQKVVIAKWLATDPKVLLLDEPTRGIDVNAKNEIYRLIGELAEAGLGIVVVSSELPEIMAICDRIIVLSEARKTAEFARSEATEELIMKAAIPRSA
ncbi:MAG: sugar ABC transporter ATP-binding protein [Phycisphaerales bacterium]|nr:MAG: sugar ABC transporter ATP-binding protein [Phycisphaerales bacterium]